MNWDVDWNVWGVPLVMLPLGVLALLVFVAYIWCLVNAAKNGKGSLEPSVYVRCVACNVTTEWPSCELD